MIVSEQNNIALALLQAIEFDDFDVMLQHVNVPLRIVSPVIVKPEGLKEWMRLTGKLIPKVKEKYVKQVSKHIYEILINNE